MFISVNKTVIDINGLFLGAKENRRWSPYKLKIERLRNPDKI